MNMIASILLWPACPAGRMAFARYAGSCSASRITTVTLRTRQSTTRMRRFCHAAISARRRSSASTGKVGHAAVRNTGEVSWLSGMSGVTEPGLQDLGRFCERESR